MCVCPGILIRGLVNTNPCTVKSVRNVLTSEVWIEGLLLPCASDIPLKQLIECHSVHTGLINAYLNDIILLCTWSEKYSPRTYH